MHSVCCLLFGVCCLLFASSQSVTPINPQKIITNYASLNHQQPCQHTRIDTLVVQLTFHAQHKRGACTQIELFPLGYISCGQISDFLTPSYWGYQYSAEGCATNHRLWPLLYWPLTRPRGYSMKSVRVYEIRGEYKWIYLSLWRSDVLLIGWWQKMVFLSSLARLFFKWRFFLLSFFLYFFVWNMWFLPNE